MGEFYGYYNPLLAMIDHAHSEGFIHSEYRQPFTQRPNPVELLDALTNHQLPDGLERWVEMN